MVEISERQGDGTLVLRVLDAPEDRLRSPSIECEVGLSELYDKVEFDAEREGDNKLKDTVAGGD